MKKHAKLHSSTEYKMAIRIRAAVIIALTIAYLCSGCEVVKHRSETKTDTTSIRRAAIVLDNKTDSGSVRTEDKRSLQEDEWFRLTLQYLMTKNDGDTTINHFIQQPATVIYEGGKSRRNDEQKVVDSSWYGNTIRLVAMAMDSMSRKLEKDEKVKRSETKGVGLTSFLVITLLAIAALGMLVLRRRR